MKSLKTRQEFLSYLTHRIRFVYTPKHSSWLNQVEIVFGIVMRKVIRRGNFLSVDDLRDKILAFIDYFNQVYARPFKWTYTGRPLMLEIVQISCVTLAAARSRVCSFTIRGSSECDGNRLLGCLEGGVDALADAADDLGQQINHGGKEQLTGVLPGSVGLEKGVELRGGQGAFQRGLDNVADWALGGETLEHGSQQYRTPPEAIAVSSHFVSSYEFTTSPWKGWATWAMASRLIAPSVFDTRRM